MCLFGSAPSSAYQRPGATEIVSVKADGSSSGTDGGTWLSSHVSKNGRFVVFETGESLVPEDLGAVDIYVHDRKLHKTQLVSARSDGSKLALDINGAWTPSMTPDGRFVAFQTANALEETDTNLASDIYVRDLKLGTTELVSIASDGSPATQPLDDHSSAEPSISADGRYVAFTSKASDLVDGDTAGYPDSFVHDRETGETIRASLSDDEREPEGGSSWTNISGNGRFVVFQNGDRSLDPNHQAEALAGLYVRDLKEGTTEWALPGGLPDAEGQAISADGRYITFNSFWNFYVPNDTNIPPLWGIDIYVYDRQTKRTERVSVSSYGEEGDHSSTDAKISGDGRYVTFESQASNFFKGDTSAEGFPNYDYDAFIHDRLTGVTELVSIPAGGGQTPPCPSERAIGQSAYDPAPSWGGRFVSFTSCSDGLDVRDSNGNFDIFVRDRGLEVGATHAPKRAPSLEGVPTFSSKGVGVLIDDQSDVATHGLGRGAEILWAVLAHRPNYSDLFVKIDIDRMPGPRGVLTAFPSAGDPSVLYGLRFEVNDVDYELRIAKQASGSGPLEPAFGLFKCASRQSGKLTSDGGNSPTDCSQAARLKGGYGTVGESVVAAIPLDAIGLEDGGRIENAIAYSAIGTYWQGPVATLDSVLATSD